MFLIIAWQSYYNILLKAAKNIKGIDIKIYSAMALEKDEEKLNSALRDIENAKLIFLYRSNETVWEYIEEKIKQGVDAKIICLSHDPSYWLLSNVDKETIAKAYNYLVINGEKNVTNMLKYLLRKCLSFPVEYEEPEKIPWEGIYHPDSKRIFLSIDDYLRWYKPKDAPFVGILFSRHYLINENLELEDLIIRGLEKRGINVIPAFSYSLKDDSLGTKGNDEVVKEFFIDKDGKPRIDAFIKLTSFFLGQKKGSDLQGKDVAEGGVELLKRLSVPCFSPISSYYKTIDEWESEKEGLNQDIGWSIAMPEFEGIIEPILVAAQIQGSDDTRKKTPINDRVEKFLERVIRWIELRRIPPEKRKVAFILHNNPCASVEATVGAGAHLDTLESVARILKRMKEVGYKVRVPEDGKALIKEIMDKKAISEFRWTTVDEIVEKGGAIAFVEKEKYLEWFDELPDKAKKRVIDAWGRPPGEWKDGIPPAMLYDGKIVITGISYGNAICCVQPKRGCAGARCDGQVCKILHDPDVPPPHQYIATYKWISREFGAHVIIHVGTHGSLEFLPGKGTGLSSSCFPDICIDTIPHLYIYNSDNPPEGTIAKRRSYAVLVDHMQTVMTGSGLYEDLEELDRLVSEYEQVKVKDRAKAHALEHIIMDTIKKTNLDKGIKNIDSMSFDEIVREIHGRLSRIRNTQIQDGMHIFGEVPKGERKVDLIYSILRYDTGDGPSIRREVAKMLGYDLAELISNQERIDEKEKKSYGEILERIDMMCKEIIKQVLMEGRDA